jgi:DsbC/DsbD-like thiol-disulfide interchange protein
MNNYFARLLVLLGMCSFPAVVSAQEQHAQAELLANVSTINPGQPFMVGVHFKIDPGWHIYWSNPGDSGLATDVKLKLPDGFTAGPVQFPVPKRLALPGDVINYAYEDEVMLLIQVTPPKELTDKTISIGGKASWLVCKDDCVPGSGKLLMDLGVDTASVPENVDLFKTWESRLPIHVGQSADVKSIDGAFKKGNKADGDQASITVHWASAPPVVYYLPDATKTGDVSNIQVATSGSVTTITFTVKGAIENQSLPGLVTYTNKSGELAGVVSSIAASEAGH